jgi:cytidine deaminase
MPFTTPDDVSWEPLLAAAWAARSHAHAPYSGFRVGAAVATAGGQVVGGCNVENAAYPMCTCAERTAVCAAAAAGMRPGQMVAVAVVTEADRLTPPCGACRQVLREFAVEVPILLANGKSKALHRLTELLPEAFGPDDLSKGPQHT